MSPPHRRTDEADGADVRSTSSEQNATTGCDDWDPATRFQTMENPFARRISSMFSISSSSSEQSSNTATSHGRRNPTKISRTPSPPKQDSVISERGPGPTQLHEPNEDSVAQASQPELERMPMSPAGMVSSPDELAQPSPPILKPPSPPCSPSSPVRETKLESRLVSRSQSGPASNSKSRSASRTRGARQSSRAESKEGTRPTSPSKLLSAPSQSERRKSTRKSWLPGKSRTHSPTGDAVPSPPKAWLVGSEAKVPYDVSRLVNFQEVSNKFCVRNGPENAYSIGSRTLGWKG